MKYSRAVDAEGKNIRSQIARYAEQLKAMAPVSDQKIIEALNEMDKPARRRWAVDRLKTRGFAVERENFGKITFTEKEINDASKYLGTAGEMAAFAALPDVLKRGIQVYHDVNHEGRGYDTFTFAAPVVINGKRGNMAAVVRKTNRYRYDVHRIVMPDGSIFVFENNNAEPTSLPAATSQKKDAHITRAISSASNNIIPGSAEKSNPKNEEGKTSRAADSLEELRTENRELESRVKELQKALRATERKLAGARESRDNWRNKATFRPETVARGIIKAYEGTISEADIHDQVKELIERAARRDGAVASEKGRSYNGTAADAAKNPKEERNLYAENTRAMRNGLMPAAEERAGEEKTCCGKGRAPECGDGQGCLPGRCAAMVFPYVSMQPANTRRYGQKEALREGTLFPGLNLPFHRELESRFPAVNTPLSELMALDFAIQELALYLDTHRDDEDALALFRSYVKLCREGREKYTAAYGPLMQTDDMEGAYTWTDDPWPWERGDND